MQRGILPTGISRGGGLKVEVPPEGDDFVARTSCPLARERPAPATAWPRRPCVRVGKMPTLQRAGRPRYVRHAPNS